jgi:hypothetical protein
MVCLVLALGVALGAGETKTTTLLVLTPVMRNTPAVASAELISAVLAGELRKVRDYQVSTLPEMEGTMSLDQRRQVAGCDTVSCAAEVAGALNSDEIVLGSVGQVGTSKLVMTFSRVQARTGRVLGHSVRSMEGTDEGATLAFLPDMARELFQPPTGQVSITGALQPKPGDPPPGSRPASDRAIRIKQRTVVTITDGHAFTSEELQAVQGPFDREVNWPEFYTTVGRPDLASSFKRRLVMRYVPFVSPVVGVAAALPLVLLGGGFLLGATALGLGGMLAPALLNQPDRYNNEPYVFGTLGVLAVGMGSFLAAVGVGMALAFGSALVALGFTVAALFVPVHPVRDDEIRRLAAAYNATL